MINKRRNKRVPLAATATLRLRGGEDVLSLQALVSDISLSGIGVYSDVPIKENTALSIDISYIFPDGLIETDSLTGKIACGRKIGNVHFIGIEFDEEITAARQPLLYEHLQRLLR